MISYETETIGAYTIAVFHDDSCEDPRERADDTVKWYPATREHDRYGYAETNMLPIALQYVTIPTDPPRGWKRKAAAFAKTDNCPHGTPDGWDCYDGEGPAGEWALQRFEECYVYQESYFAEKHHVAVISLANVRKHWHAFGAAARVKGLEVLASYTREVRAWAEGYCYGWGIFPEDCGSPAGYGGTDYDLRKALESCWGYIGREGIDSGLSEARAMVASMIETDNDRLVYDDGCGD